MKHFLRTRTRWQWAILGISLLLVGDLVAMRQDWNAFGFVLMFVGFAWASHQRIFR